MVKRDHVHTPTSSTTLDECLSARYPAAGEFLHVSMACIAMQPTRQHAEYHGVRGPSLTCNIGECVSKEEGAACRDTRGHNLSKAYGLLKIISAGFCLDTHRKSYQPQGPG